MYTALIVDDEPLILKGLKNIINWEDYGIEITGQAENGVEALNIIESTKINILITDIKMPQMDGLELIRRIKQKGLNIKFVILSGYDDFVLVKEAAKLGIENYLLKPVIRDELESTTLNIIEKIESELHKQIRFKSDFNILRNSIICRWLTGSISFANLSERAGLLNIDISSRKYLVCLVKVLYGNLFADQSTRTDIDKSLIDFTVENICNEVISKDCKVLTLCDLSGYIVSIFYGDNSDFDNMKVYELLEECKTNICKSLKCDVFITIGSYEYESQYVHKSYANAINLMDYRLILSPNTIIDYNKIVKSSKIVHESIRFNFDAFRNHMAFIDKDKAISFIDEVFGKLKQADGITPLYIQNTSVEILYNILHTLNIKKIDTNSLFDSYDNLFLQLLKLKSIDELSGWLKLIVIKTIDKLLLEDENANPLIKMVLTYLDSNYAGNISLKTISALFNVNAAYLGQLFIKKIGETFSNYLNKMRIEKAEELLQNTKMGINEIAEKVGYCNQSYFSNLFKKIKNVYPTKYKRNVVDVDE